MIDTAPLSSADISANKLSRGYTGSVFDGNPGHAWYLLPLLTAIDRGIIRAEKNIEF